jgi:exonuclease SbcC
MRPIRLSVQAFSSYTQEQVLEFGPLSEAGIFLIRGEMGAGKTSLFDAISYCLFGKASGGEDRPAKYLRSQLAPVSLPTVLQFDFSVGDDLYRIERRIEFRKMRAARGTKNAPDAPISDRYQEEKSAKLYRCLDRGDGHWNEAALLADDEKSVTLRAQEILGLSHEQFSKVILLPQGKFRQFLDADSAARESILEALFRTRPIAEFQQRIKERASELERHYGGLRSEIDGILKSQGVETAAQLTEQKDILQADIVRLEPEAERLNETHRKALEALERGKQVSNAFSELDRIRQEAQNLDERKPLLEAMAAKLASARHALQVQPVLLEEAHFLRTLEKVQNDLPHLELSHQHANELLISARHDLGRLEGSERSEKPVRQLELQKLESQEKSLRILESQRQQISALNAALAEKQSRAGHLETKVAELKGQQQRLTESFSRLSALSSQIAERKTLRDELQRVQKAYSTLAEVEANVRTLHARLSSENSEVEKTKAALDAAVAAELHAEQEWMAGQAALLASKLITGESCPVCGSHDHPQPAKEASLASNLAGTPRDRLLAAKKLHRECAQNLSDQQNRLNLTGQKIEAEEARKRELLHQSPALSEGEAGRASQNGLFQKAERALDESIQAGESARKAHSELGLIAKQLEEAHQNLGGLKVDQARDEGMLLNLEKNQAELLQSLDGEADLREIAQKRTWLSGWLTRFDQEIQDARQKIPQLTTRAAELGTRLDQTRRLISEQTLALDGVRNRLSQSLSENGFSDVENCRINLLGPHAITQLETALSDAALAEARVTERKLAIEQSIRASALTQAPDIESLEEAFRNSRDELDKQLAEIMRLRTLRESNQRALTSCESTLKRMLEVETLHRRIGHIADIAAGGKENALKLSFHRYVLAVFFDEIVESANLRLNLLSEGRYGLKRPVLPGSRVGARGLDLMIEDAMTGQERPTGSLSGGEGFLASLSLALGLSDVVQNDRSGLPMEAVFIDEGFGNLDEGAVENVVLRALKDLRQSGRMVGIISHIPHLKNLIPVQVQVTKSQDGSRIQVQGI